MPHSRKTNHRVFDRALSESGAFHHRTNPNRPRRCSCRRHRTRTENEHRDRRRRRQPQGLPMSRRRLARGASTSPSRRLELPATSTCLPALSAPSRSLADHCSISKSPMWSHHLPGGIPLSLDGGTLSLLLLDNYKNVYVVSPTRNNKNVLGVQR